jgi:aminodeoxyfutalosine deaminase
MTAEVAGRFDTFIKGLPKAELHVHHVGSASARIVGELASRHPGTVPSDLDELRRFYEFRDFAHFIEVYLAVVALIKTPEDIHYLTYEVAREMATEQSLRYAELTCTPYTSVRPDQPDAGMAIEAFTELRRPGRGRARLRAGAALDLRHPGEFGVPSADATLDYALNHRPEGWSASASVARGRLPRPRFQYRFERREPPVCTACPRRRPRAADVGLAERPAGGRIGHGTRGPGPGAASAPWRDGYRSRCAVVERRHRAVGTLDRSVPGRRGDRELRRPTDVRHHVSRQYESPRTARARRGRGGRPGPDRRAGVVRPDDVRQRVLGRIDAYVAG